MNIFMTVMRLQGWPRHEEKKKSFSNILKLFFSTAQGTDVQLKKCKSNQKCKAMTEIIMERFLLSVSEYSEILLNFLLNENENNKELRATVCKYQPKLSLSGTKFDFTHFLLIDNLSMSNETGCGFGSIWTTRTFPAQFFLIDLWKYKYFWGQKGIVKNGPNLQFLLCQIIGIK